MWLLGSLFAGARSPLGASGILTGAIVAIVLIAGLWLRVETRHEVAAQCAAEKQLAGLKRILDEQTRFSAGLIADAAAQAKIIAERDLALAASEASIKSIADEADALREQVNKLDASSRDAVFSADDAWLRRKRAAPAAGVAR